MKINYNNLGNYNVPSDCRNGICLDIGSNVGNFFSKHSNFFSLIHYYEPVDDNWKVCSSKKYKNVRGFKNAVGSSDDEVVQLYVHSSQDSGSCRVNNGHRDWTSEIVADVKTCCIETCLQRIFDESNADILDYMKIDCECSEYEFFLGKDLSMIKYIGMELHCQLGREKSKEVFDWISRTHKASVNFSWNENRNIEMLWTNT